jgi:hypothetical protein
MNGSRVRSSAGPIARLRLAQVFQRHPFNALIGNYSQQELPLRDPGVQDSLPDFRAFVHPVLTEHFRQFPFWLIGIRRRRGQVESDATQQ